MNLIEFLKNNIDYFVLGTLGFMSFIMFWMAIERVIFFSSIKLKKYDNLHKLDNDLTENLTVIYTVGANAPYVGLLGTVVGILLTFYDMGKSAGDIDTSHIMFGLAIALKATALGILLAIPSMILYNALARVVEVKKAEWLSTNELS